MGLLSRCWDMLAYCIIVRSPLGAAYLVGAGVLCLRFVALERTLLAPDAGSNGPLSSTDLAVHGICNTQRLPEPAHGCGASAARMSSSWSRSTAAIAARSTSSSAGGPGGAAPGAPIQAGSVAARPRPTPAMATAAQRARPAVFPCLRSSLMSMPGAPLLATQCLTMWPSCMCDLIAVCALALATLGMLSTLLVKMYAPHAHESPGAYSKCALAWRMRCPRPVPPGAI